MTRLLYALRGLFRIQIKHPRYRSENVDWNELRKATNLRLAREIGNPNHKAVK